MICNSSPSLSNSKKDTGLEIDILNKKPKKENFQEKDDILGDINSFQKHGRRQSRSSRLSTTTISTINTVNSVNSKIDEDIHFESDGKCKYLFNIKY